jgi:hypothetical protein
MLKLGPKSCYGVYRERIRRGYGGARVRLARALRQMRSQSKSLHPDREAKPAADSEYALGGADIQMPWPTEKTLPMKSPIP